MKTQTVVDIVKALCSECWDNNDPLLKHDLEIALFRYKDRRLNRMPDLSTEEKNLVLTGAYVDSIKIYRERTGETLSDSKKKVDNFKDSR